MRNPAQLHPYDPAWATRATALLRAIRDALADLPRAVEADYDHIGSTAVPGLAAKRYLDLQIRITPLPTDDELSARLDRLGFARNRGSRPDSPGVCRDTPRGSQPVDGAVWEKSLFTHESEGAILHVRKRESP